MKSCSQVLSLSSLCSSCASACFVTVTSLTLMKLLQQSVRQALSQLAESRILYGCSLLSFDQQLPSNLKSLY